jgi:hypothetical protein
MNFRGGFLTTSFFAPYAECEVMKRRFVIDNIYYEK